MVPLDSSPAGVGRYGIAERVPYGVVAAITPFNAPANLLVQKVAPALVTGNAVIVKPSPEGAAVALEIAKLFEQAGLPARSDGPTSELQSLMRTSYAAFCLNTKS